MALKVGTKCILLSEPWNEIRSYRVSRIDGDKVFIRAYLDVVGLEPERELSADELPNLFATPYSTESTPRQRDIAERLQDLASSVARDQDRYPVDDLAARLSEDWRFSKLPRPYILGCLRSLVASGFFSVWFDGRKGDPEFCLVSTDRTREQERERIYAATFASELVALSERVRDLIRHTGTVGTYRENLLQALLRKGVPERYHVATGFIHRCRRQLDVLIYDCVDYAPLFREGDLVVVPAESVRAVIEVKTGLTTNQLKDSISLLQEVAELDDLAPPFFRGVFGFESDLTPEQIEDVVVDAYTSEDYGDWDDLDSPEWTHLITQPYQHISAVCVLQHAFCFVDYVRDGENRFIPMLVSGTSTTGLRSEAAHFFQLLLSYLRFEAMKPSSGRHFTQLLGSDTEWREVEKLVPMDHWGAYFQQDEMGGGEGEVAQMERHIEQVQRWLIYGTRVRL